VRRLDSMLRLWIVVRVSLLFQFSNEIDMLIFTYPAGDIMVCHGGFGCFTDRVDLVIDPPCGCIGCLRDAKEYFVLGQVAHLPGRNVVLRTGIPARVVGSPGVGGIYGGWNKGRHFCYL